MMAMSSATTSDNFLPFAASSDNSKLRLKSDHLSRTQRTVRFQEEFSMPTVECMRKFLAVSFMLFRCYMRRYERRLTILVLSVTFESRLGP